MIVCVYQDVAIKVYFGNDYSEGTLQDFKKEVFRTCPDHLFDCKCYHYSDIPIPRPHIVYYLD